MTPYIFQRGETISLALDVVSGDALGVSSVTAQMKAVPPGRTSVPAGTAIAVNFIVTSRAAAGQLKLSEMVALFWHCLADRRAVLRTDLGDAVAAAGLAAATPALRTLLGQILQGR